MLARGFGDAATGFLPKVDQRALRAGAENLLRSCADIRPGQRVLVLRERPGLGWYDRAGALAVARTARAMGAEVDVIAVGGPEDGLSPETKAALSETEVEIWFARIGDQDRFCDRNPERIRVVSYARTEKALASGFGTRPHEGMVQRKVALESRLAAARAVRITCALGTDIVGNPQAAEVGEVAIRRFPMCVPCPTPAAGFTGRVALRGYLCPTGSRSYTPASIRLDGVVFAEIAGGRIAGFEGPREDVARVRAHYEHVGGLFDIDPFVVHSWHAGIHPDCPHDIAPEPNPDLWANTVFGSPRWLHFHTCGDVAPGEICWMIDRPTITADGVALWDNGRLSG